MDHRRLRELNAESWATYLFLIIQVIVFVLEQLAGGSENTQVLLYYGAKVNAYVQFGEWWRLITPIFVHIGFMHILFNSLALYYIGINLEQIIGHWRFIVIYMISGVVGNLASFAFGASNAISAGASTSLFGLIGVYIALGYLFKDHYQLRAMGQQFIGLAVLNLVLDLLMSGIDIWGHLGGLVGGVLLTMILIQTYRQPYSRQMFRLAMIIVLALISGLMYGLGMGVFA